MPQPTLHAPTVDELHQHVWQHSEDTLVWREVSAPTVYTVETMAQRLHTLAAPLHTHALLIDLTGAGRPSGDVRSALKAAFGRYPLYHAAAFTERNMILNAFAYFVLGGLGLPSHSVHRTQASALMAIDGAREAFD